MVDQREPGKLMELMPVVHTNGGKDNFGRSIGRETIMDHS